MTKPHDAQPQLSYVLSAVTEQEVHSVACWLRDNRLSSEVEVILAAPAKVFARVAARAIPASVTLASADGVADRKAVQVAGARQTTGLVVICISCDDDFGSLLRDPFAAAAPDAEQPSQWAAEAVAELPAGRVEVGVVSVVR